MYWPKIPRVMVGEAAITQAEEGLAQVAQSRALIQPATPLVLASRSGSGRAELCAAPDLEPRVAASRVRYYFACDSKPVSLYPLGGLNVGC
jgi:hypothetical protein